MTAVVSPPPVVTYERPAPRPAAVRVTEHLPEPPDDAQKISYFGAQYRWISLLSFGGFVLIAVGLTFFVLRRPWAGVLLVPLAISAIGAGISLATGARGRRSTLAHHQEKVASWTPAAYPSVDVFLPSAGEELDVLENTFQHVAALRWPGDLAVHVLDDSGRPEVELLAERFGFRYTVRPDRGVLKKAGNLRHGFTTSGHDFIAIFDADFVPRPDYLSELVPYFDDEQIAIVQSPQYFDMTRRMNWLQRAAGATQVLFYSWVQPSRDRYDAAICVGTSAVYRRSALNRSGGFAQIGHSEDVHTGVNLMKVGYIVRYVPIVVSKGLCPTGFDQFVTQQYRWCTGSMSLLFSKAFHRLKLTRMQRLCYWSGFLYYITTGLNVFVASIPSIIMAWFAADKVKAANYVFVLLALACRQVVVPVITMGKESFFGLARVQSTYSFAHALALRDVLGGSTDSWVATGERRRSRTATRIRRITMIWILGTQGLMWTALAIDVPRYGIGNFWPMVVFAAVNLYVMLPIALGDADFSWRGLFRSRRSAVSAEAVTA